MLVSGVYKNDGPFTAYINIGRVRELYTITHGPPLVLGANVSIAQCIKVFKEMPTIMSGYHHLTEIADHWNAVANVSVRNVSFHFTCVYVSVVVGTVTQLVTVEK